MLIAGTSRQPLDPRYSNGRRTNNFRFPSVANGTVDIKSSFVLLTDLFLLCTFQGTNFDARNSHRIEIKRWRINIERNAVHCTIASIVRESIFIGKRLLEHGTPNNALPVRWTFILNIPACYQCVGTIHGLHKIFRY